MKTTRVLLAAALAVAASACSAEITAPGARANAGISQSESAPAAVEESTISEVEDERDSGALGSGGG